MINITVISELNKTITIQSLSSSTNSSHLANTLFNASYDNYLMKIETNTAAAGLQSFIDSMSFASGGSILGAVIVMGCVIGFIYAIIKAGKYI